MIDSWCKPILDHDSIGSDAKEIHMARIDELKEIVQAYNEGIVDVVNAFYYSFLLGSIGDIDDLHTFPNVWISESGLIFFMRSL